MKRLFQISLLLSVQFAFAQHQVFENFNFEEGGYYVLGMEGESDPNMLADSL